VAVQEVIGHITEVALADELTTIILVTHDIMADGSGGTIWLLGRDRDATGNRNAGSRIKGYFYFMARGWRGVKTLSRSPGLAVAGGDSGEIPEFVMVWRSVDDGRLLREGGRCPPAYNLIMLAGTGGVSGSSSSLLPAILFGGLDN